MCDRIQIEAHIYSLHCDIKSGLVKKKNTIKSDIFPRCVSSGKSSSSSDMCVYFLSNSHKHTRMRARPCMNERARAYNENKVVGASRRGFFYVSTCATGKSGNCELYIYFGEMETDESHVRERVAEFITHISLTTNVH